MRESEARCTLRKMAAFYQCVRPDPSEPDMISTRVMDVKLRESAEGLGEDGTGKKKSKFKTFKKLFGKKKRKESPSSTGNSTWKQNQAKSEVIAIESGPVGYDSEDELEESRGTLGNRALSHDSIFFPESGQDPARPVRVFSQENVCDRIKALQLKIQCNVKMGPPPPGGIPIKRAEETGLSSEDDGLPRSPPEMSLLHDAGPGTTIKILVSSSQPQSPDHTSDATVSSRTLDGSLAPVADFSHPPESSSCLDNSAAKHKLLVKPRNQRSSKMRRLSSRAQSESLSDLSWTLEEEEHEKKPLLRVNTEVDPSSGHWDLMLGRRPELGGPATLLLPGGACARRARLQHSAAVSGSMEEGSSPGDEPSSHQAMPELTEPMAVSVPCPETPSLPQDSPYHIPHSEIQKEELSSGGLCPLVENMSEEVFCDSGDVETPLSTDVPDGGMAPPKDSVAPEDTTALPEGETVPSKEDITPPEGDTTQVMAPPKRDMSPSKGDVAPPKRIIAPPEKDMSPPERDMSPSKGDVAPPERDMSPPERDMSPSKEDVAPPKRIMAPPERDMSPSKGDVAPPKRIMAPPERDMSPSNEDMTPPKGIMEPPNRDTILPKEEAPPPEVVTDTNLETPSDTEGQEQSVQKEEELTLVVPRSEEAGTESCTVPSPSPPVPKSCLKHKVLAPSRSPAESHLKESSPRVQDRAVVPPARPRPAQATASGGPEKAALGRKCDRSTEPQRNIKRFSVTSSRARARASSSRLLEHSGHAPAGGRAPLLRSGLAWKSEAALDDLQVLPEPQDRKAVGGDPQDSRDMGAGQAGPGSSLQDADTCASSVKEPVPGEDQSPFPVKLRSTSLSLKYRDGSAQEAKAVKRYSAEVRLERGGLTLHPKDEQSHAGPAPTLRSSRSPNGQGKGKSRSPEQSSIKPPLPRKPLLQSLTLQYPPAGLDASPGESERLIAVIPPPEPRKEKSPQQGTEKGQPPAATGPGADGQPTPPWITMARQKRRGAPDLPVNQEDKPGSRILKTETGKQTQESVKQGDFVRSKSFLMTPAKPPVTQRQGSKLSLKEGLQRGISLSHQNLAQAAAMTEKELHQLKRASYTTSTDQPSWMELARKKSQAWSDMPQIIK
ncbi:CRACD-like protein isoform X2 [Microtus oregoni]|uniref:CRACD-like protein isoform X2 n=1 Tax=Microtus oregoni TaxID=111838 RepID=UPI001BB2339B|nr:CRACD-like protein isoform X2 [Microtus oregoni]